MVVSRNLDKCFCGGKSEFIVRTLLMASAELLVCQTVPPPFSSSPLRLSKKNGRKK